jgi:acyl-coenzyme A thioesterase PaaI-like protein
MDVVPFAALLERACMAHHRPSITQGCQELSKMDMQTRSRIDAILEIPLNRYMGLVLDGAGDGTAQAHFDVGPEHLAFGGLHAGVLSSLMEATRLFSLFDSLEPSEHAVTHDLHASVMFPVPAGLAMRLNCRGDPAGPHSGFHRSKGGGER